MKRLKLALSFLTRVPVGEIKDLKDEEWPKSMVFYPFCGLIIALLVIGPLWLAQCYLPASPLMWAVIGTALSAYWTGGLHLDGFADVCDGFGCPTDRQTRVKIMKDPTVGSFAAIGLILLLLMKTTAFFHLFQKSTFIEAAGIIVFARFLLVYLAAIGKYPNEKGIGKFVIGNVSLTIFIASILLVLPFFYFYKFAIAIAVMLLAAMWLKRKADKLIGGITGDVLGCALELGETVGLVVLALL